MDAREEWSYTNEYRCRSCDAHFAVLTPDDTDPDFCPFCGNRDIEPLED